MPGGVSLYKSLVQDLILTPLLKNEVGTGKRGALTSRIYQLRLGFLAGSDQRSYYFFVINGGRNYEVVGL